MLPIEEAAGLIRAGRLVAFPTETVYGLGANALDAEAVARIYAAKGRPASSPLIVHVDSVEMARQVVSAWPEAADKLARRFWPGPLTLVLPKRDGIPDCVTAGLATVGVRVPAHPVALALIRAAGVPIAAPSANKFTGLSPTTAAHVRAALGNSVALVLDDGPAQVGIESAVLSLDGPNAVLLRPGMISRADIEDVIGPVHLADGAGSGAHASPGLHPKHYSPRTPLFLYDSATPEPAGRGASLWLTIPFPAAYERPMPRDPAGFATALYSTLHELDTLGFDWIALERPPDDPAWSGILDRLHRASTR